MYFLFKEKHFLPKEEIFSLFLFLFLGMKYNTLHLIQDHSWE